MGVKEKFFFLKWLDPFTYVEIALRKAHPKQPGAVHEGIDWAVYIVSALFFAFLLYSFLGFLLGTSYPMVIVLSGSMEPVYYRGDVIVLQGTEGKDISAPLVELNAPTLKGVEFDEIGSTVCAHDSLKEAMPCSFFYRSPDAPNLNPAKFRATKINFRGTGQSVNVTTKGDIIVFYSPTGQKDIIHRAVAKIKAGDGYYFLTKGDSVRNPLIDQDELVKISSYPVKESEIKGKALFRVPFIGWIKLLIFDELPSLFRG